MNCYYLASFILRWHYHKIHNIQLALVFFYPLFVFNILFNIFDDKQKKDDWITQIPINGGGANDNANVDERWNAVMQIKQFMRTAYSTIKLSLDLQWPFFYLHWIPNLSAERAKNVRNWMNFFLFWIWIKFGIMCYV